MSYEPTGPLTVNQLIARLQEQAEHGRGEYLVSIRPMGRRGSWAPLVVAGLPAEAGEKVGIFASDKF